jgi:hypothetical protein
MPGRSKIYEFKVSAVTGGPKKYESVEWATASPRLNAARNILYPNGYKQISPALLSMLGAQAIAWLYMDDGNLSVDNCSICMTSHSKDEILMTRDWIEMLTGVGGYFYEAPAVYGNSIVKNKLLKFGANEYKPFLDVIREYAAPGMEYKFDY